MKIHVLQVCIRSAIKCSSIGSIALFFDSGRKTETAQFEKEKDIICKNNVEKYCVVFAQWTSVATKQIIYAFSFSTSPLINCKIKNMSKINLNQVNGGEVQSFTANSCLAFCPHSSSLCGSQLGRSYGRVESYLSHKAGSQILRAQLGSGAERLPASPALLNSPPAKTAE